jgi:hypothetical protein
VKPSEDMLEIFYEAGQRIFRLSFECLDRRYLELRGVNADPDTSALAVRNSLAKTLGSCVSGHCLGFAKKNLGSRPPNWVDSNLTFGIQAMFAKKLTLHSLGKSWESSEPVPAANDEPAKSSRKTTYGADAPMLRGRLKLLPRLYLSYGL